MEVIKDNAATLVDDHLANSILDAIGLPRHLDQASITITKQEESFLQECIDGKNFDRLRHTFHHDDESAMKLCMDQKNWHVGGLAGVFSLSLYQPRLLEVMLFVAIDFNNATVVEGLTNLFVDLHQSIAVVFLDRLLATACKRGATEIAELLLSTFEYTPERCTSALVSFVTGLQRGAEINMDISNAVGLILKAGADPNASHPPDRHGHGFLLQQAVYHKSLDAIDLLLLNGARLDQSGALQAAVAIDYIDGLETLLQHGANVNELLKERLRSTPDGQILSKANESVLSYAVRCNSSEAANWLLANGADPKLFQETSLMRLGKDRRRMALAETIWAEKRKQHRKRQKEIKQRNNGTKTLNDCWDKLTISRGMDDKTQHGEVLTTNAAEMTEWKQLPQKFRFEIKPMTYVPPSSNTDSS